MVTTPESADYKPPEEEGEESSSDVSDQLYKV